MTTILAARTIEPRVEDVAHDPAKRRTEYLAFLGNKAALATAQGPETSTGADAIHPALLPHQRAMVEWAVRGGRRAIFAVAYVEAAAAGANVPGLFDALPAMEDKQASA